MKSILRILLLATIVSIPVIGCGNKEDHTIDVSAIDRISVYNEKDKECFTTNPEYVNELKTMLSTARYAGKAYNDGREGVTFFMAYHQDDLVYNIYCHGDDFFLDDLHSPAKKYLLTEDWIERGSKLVGNIRKENE